MSGPMGGLDWHFASWTPGMADSLCEQLSNADTILLGRVTYVAMANYWQLSALDHSFPRENLAFAEMINSCRKIVFSKTLSSPDWYNSKLIKGDIGKEIRKLKVEPGKDMIVFGSGILASALMQLQLIDEYVLWVHPVVLGRGKALFHNVAQPDKLRLHRITTFNTGVVVLYYHAITELARCTVSTNVLQVSL